ncbi:MAG: hypothetical protein JST93_12340 [Acidobacteria bacterium]|nr:hypothetical protein [Acidobacteriota bacterium]
MRLAAVFLAAFLYHATSPVSQQGDSRWTVFTAMSLLREGNVDLNEYGKEIEASGFYAIECVTGRERRYPIHSLAECPNGRLYNFYPISISLLATPFIAVQWGLLRLLPFSAANITHPVLRGYLSADPVAGSPIFEIVAASVFVALATMLFYRVALRYLDARQALFAAFVFTACTPMVSTASRALWQHGVLAVLLSAVLLVLPHASAGPLLALAFFVRPTAAIPIALFAVFLLRHHRKQAVQAALWGLPVVAGFVALNYNMYGMPLAPYFFPVRAGSTSLGMHGNYLEALAGTMISPARGLLVYMPFLLLAPFAWRNGSSEWRRMAGWIGVMALGHWLLISLHSDWWGGHAFGPRYFTDIIPLLVFLTIPAIKVRGKAFLGLALLAFVIHFRGSHIVATQIWNVTPVNVNADTSRLWDWSDPPFLR